MKFPRVTAGKQMQRYPSACTKDFQKRSPKKLKKYFSLLHLLSLSHVYCLMFSFSFPLPLSHPACHEIPKERQAQRTSINKPENKTKLLATWLGLPPSSIIYKCTCKHQLKSFLPDSQLHQHTSLTLNRTLTNTCWIQWICTRFRCTLNFMFDLSRRGCGDGNTDVAL